MALIKITGFIETDDLEDSYVDLDHEMGLSNEGFEKLSIEMGLQDVDFRLVP